MKILIYIMALCYMILCQISGELIAEGIKSGQITGIVVGIVIFALEFKVLLDGIETIIEEDKKRNGK